MTTTYRYRNPAKRRAYMRERMNCRRLWLTHKNCEAMFFRAWAQLFVQMVAAL
jgi:hypothetical protein